MKSARKEKSGYNMGGMAETKVFKKGGHAMKKSTGGTIYEREMDGEHPTSKMHHVNYEAQMRGEHPSHGRQMLAAGGVAKIRHEEATSTGKPIRKCDSKVKLY